MQALGRAIGLNFADIGRPLRLVEPVVSAPSMAAPCNVDPSCVQTRDQLHQVLEAARDDGTFDKLAELGRQLQSTSVNEPLDADGDEARSSTGLRDQGSELAGLRQPAAVVARAAGANSSKEPTGSRRREPTDRRRRRVSSSTRPRRSAAVLGEASQFLLSMKSGRQSPADGGLLHPPQILDR